MQSHLDVADGFHALLSSPLSRDVMIIYDRYFDRLGKYKLSRMQEEANSRVMAVPAEPLTRPRPPPPPVVVPQNPPVDATPALKTVADNGDPITILVRLIAITIFTAMSIALMCSYIHSFYCIIKRP